MRTNGANRSLLPLESRRPDRRKERVSETSMPPLHQGIGSSYGRGHDGHLPFYLIKIQLSLIPLAIFVYGIYFYTLRPFEVRWSTRRAFAKRNDRNMLMTFRFVDGRILIHSELGQSDSPWESICRVLQTPDGFLLFSDPEIFHFLPKRGFKDPEEIPLFSKLCSEMVEHISHLR
ncbi:MAG: YcxB family protein [Luteolibacter sp.]